MMVEISLSVPFPSPMNFFSGVILYLSQDSAKIMTDVEEYED